LYAFTQAIQRASSQSTHHLVAGEFSPILAHGSQLVFNDIPKVRKIYISDL
jgi:phage tail protein X